MKEYLVDTNIPSELTRPQPEPRVVDFIRKAGKENLFLSVVTIGEICKGIDLLPESWSEQNPSNVVARFLPTSPNENDGAAPPNHGVIPFTWPCWASKSSAHAF